MKIFRVDIDDTLFHSEYKEGKYKIISIETNIIKKINKLYDNGNIIIIETGRHWNHFEITLKQLKGLGIKYHTLVMGKPICDYIVDDKAVRPNEFLGIDI